MGIGLNELLAGTASEENDMPITILETTFAMKGTMAELRALEKLLGRLSEARQDTTIQSTEFTPDEWSSLVGMYHTIAAHNMSFAS